MWLKLDTSAQVNDETALLFLIYFLLLLVSFQGWDFSLNFNVCAVSNLSAFLPGTLLLYRQFILPSSNALFLLTADRGGFKGKLENLGGSPEWCVHLRTGDS